MVRTIFTLSLLVSLALTGVSEAQYSDCGTLIADSSGFSCALFSPDAGGGPYQLDAVGAFVIGDYVSVTGTLLTLFPTFCWDPVGAIQGTVIEACVLGDPFDECGQLVEGPTGCTLLEDAAGNTYELDLDPAPAVVGDFVHVTSTIDVMCVGTCGATGGCLEGVSYSLCESDFVRGDANGDGTVDIADAVFILSALFVSGSDMPACRDAADVNDDGGLDISDAVTTLSALFIMGGIPAPDGACGPDPTPDAVDCVSSACP